MFTTYHFNNLDISEYILFVSVYTMVLTYCANMMLDASEKYFQMVFDAMEPFNGMYQYNETDSDWSVELDTDLSNLRFDSEDTQDSIGFDGELVFEEVRARGYSMSLSDTELFFVETDDESDDELYYYSESHIDDMELTEYSMKKDTSLKDYYKKYLEVGTTDDIEMFSGLKPTVTPVKLENRKTASETWKELWE